MARKKNKKQTTKLTTRQLQQEIFRLFKRHPKRRFNPKQIYSKLEVDNNRDSIRYALDQLVESKKVVELDDYKFKLNKENASRKGDTRILQGRVDMTRSGSAFIIVEDLEEDVFVPARNLNSALNGDQVEIKAWKVRGRQRPEGQVTRVINRASEHFMGTIHLSQSYGFVVPDKLNMPVDIYVDLDNIKGAQDKDKVVVKIIEWPSEQNKSPVGVVTSVLGQVGGSDIEMKGILINNGFELDFPEAVLEETTEMRGDILTQEVHLRRDMREVTTFTIDPEDAKDFDDALSLRYLENGNREVGVHIADVTHFVKPGSALDQEALKRSTSVYLVDRVLPMLPEKLSNELCSLRPHEDKYTFSAVFEFDKDDRIVNRWFGKTVTHSNHRFTYEDAQRCIETGVGELAKEVQELNRLAHKLRKDRFKNGSIDFDSEEVRFRLDDDGVPISVYVKERKEAHMLVEDFMLLANKEVATYIHERGKEQEIPFVYRIHDTPDPDKVAELAAFSRELGFQMKIGSPEQIARSFNSLSKAAEKERGLRLLAPLAIRTMAKAAYSTDNIGHYGLAFPYYTHFTSPIRRYSDVLVHRVLDENLNGKTMRLNKVKLEEKCKHISLQERKAMDAERESIKYKQVEFMERHIGETFEGHVSGIIDRGFFVELAASKCEGLVSFDTLSEPFAIHESRLRAKGLRTNKELKMGDLIKVRIVDTDLAKRNIEMEWEEDL